MNQHTIKPEDPARSVHSLLACPVEPGPAVDRHPPWSHHVNPPQLEFDVTVERLFQSLICGDRSSSRQIVQETVDSSQCTAEELTHQVYWPVLEMISTLYRADQLTALAHHYSTRLLRSLIDQAQANYRQKSRRNKKIVMFSGTGDTDELCGQLVADLIEADGYITHFAGGGIANDEILAEVGEQRPDILLMFASSPSDAPNIRQLIDTIRGVNACPNMQIVVGGGVFNRAPGLAEEIGADLWATNPLELIEKLTTQSARRATADQRTVGKTRKVSSGTEGRIRAEAA
jgi:methanogenic corrinoid protein MtbC1